MKKLLHSTRLATLLAAAGFVAAASAQDFTVGKLSYEFVSEEEHTVAIAESDEGYTDLTQADFSTTVANGGVTYTVVGIGDYGLSYSTLAEDIVLPATIKTIGEAAFEECEGQKITLPAGLEEYAEGAFSTALIEGFEIADTNTLLATVDGVLMTADKKTIVCYPAMRRGAKYTVPEYVTTLGSYSFANGDEYLEEVVFHSGMTVEQSAFRNNGNILRIELPGDIVLSQASFMGCEAVTELVLHEGITEIPRQCFFDLCALPTLNLPEGLVTIGPLAFGFAEVLTSVTFPSSLQTVDENAFADSGELATVDFANVKTIGESAFARCGLTTVNAAAVETVGSNAFDSNTKLTRVELPAAVTLGSIFFRNSALKEVVFGPNLTTMGGTFFYECNALESVNIPASVTSIGRGIFSGTASLTSVTGSPENTAYEITGNIIYTKDMKKVMAVPGGIKNWDITFPAGITTIGEMAMRKCANVNSVVLPATCTTIENLAFADCTGLTAVTSLNPVPPTGCNFPESVYTSATLYLPNEEAVTAYKADPDWGKFINISYTTGGIRGIDADRADTVIFYDLSGGRVVNPENGVYLRRTVKPDGTVTIEKVMLK